MGPEWLDVNIWNKLKTFWSVWGGGIAQQLATFGQKGCQQTQHRSFRSSPCFIPGPALVCKCDICWCPPPSYLMPFFGVGTSGGAPVGGGNGELAVPLPGAPQRHPRCGLVSRPMERQRRWQSGWNGEGVRDPYTKQSPPTLAPRAIAPLAPPPPQAGPASQQASLFTTGDGKMEDTQLLFQLMLILNVSTLHKCPSFYPTIARVISILRANHSW